MYIDNDIARNIHWDLQRVEWDNLFNYGEGNSIDFTKLNGVVSLAGKNYSGKSSAVQTLPFTILNNNLGSL
jgi:hypothetical protein